jgi:hypothetical protein
MRTKLSVLIVSVLTLTADLASSQQQRQAAVIVEADALPGCVGLDCPPWPTPLDFNVCIRIGKDFYSGTYLPWKGPWAKKINLNALEGKSDEAVVTAKHLRVLASRVDARLTRIYPAKGFRNPSCNKP